MDDVQVEELLTLLEDWTRCEVIARLGTLENSVDCMRLQVKKKDEIRRLLYGTDDLVVLGLKWGLLKPTDKKGHKDG